MNVAILIASLGGGGAEKMAIRLREGLSRAGMNSRLILLDNNREYDVTSAKVLSFSKNSWPTLVKAAIIPWQVYGLESYLKKHNINVVISFLERANIVNLIQNVVPCRIISIRSHPSKLMASKSPFKRKLVSLGYRKLLSRANAIIGNSKEMIHDFERIYGADLKRLGVIYNFFDKKALEQAATEALSPADEKMFQGRVIITAGRFNHEKGQYHLIRAFKKICTVIEDARLIILGKGDLFDTFTRMCDRFGITDKVFFPGFVSNPAKYIARADMFAFPSLWEGFPNALLEAMSLGIPIISTDCSSGPREILAPGTSVDIKTKKLEKTDCGILIPPLDGRIRQESATLSKSESYLSDGIVHMLNDPVYLGNCKKAVVRRASSFSENSIIPQWVELIKEIKADADS